MRRVIDTETEIRNLAAIINPACEDRRGFAREAVERAFELWQISSGWTWRMALQAACYELKILTTENV